MNRILDFNPRLNYVLLFFLLSRIFIFIASLNFVGNSQIYLESLSMHSSFALELLPVATALYLSHYFEPHSFQAIFSLQMMAIDFLVLYLLYQYAKKSLKFDSAHLSYLVLLYSALGLAFPHIYYHRVQMVASLLMVIGLYLAKNRLYLSCFLLIALSLMRDNLEFTSSNLESLTGNILLIFDIIGSKDLNINYSVGKFMIELGSSLNKVFFIIFLVGLMPTIFISLRRPLNPDFIGLFLAAILSYVILIGNSVSLIIAVPIIALIATNTNSRPLLLFISAIYVSNFISSQFDYFGLASKNNLMIIALTIKHLSLIAALSIIIKHHIPYDKAKN